MLKEFKEFALKGNVLDLAIGIIIGVAFGAIHWETTKAGNPNRCTADTPSPVNPHLLSTFQVYMSCDPGPLGDNGVTVRAAGIDLMVPFEMTPPVFSQEVPN